MNATARDRGAPAVRAGRTVNERARARGAGVSERELKSRARAAVEEAPLGAPQRRESI
eukprot:COSAG02_NODE_1532_length_12086_cov_6.489447_1_plen_58_part_00